METLKTFLLAFLVMMMYACNETNMEKQGSGANESLTPGTGTSGANTAAGSNRATNDNSTNSSNNDVPRPDAVETNTVSEEVNTATSDFNNASNYDGTRANDNTVPERQQQMYKELNMTESQIRRYENTSRTATDKWRQNNPNRNMTLQNQRDIERNSLQAVLDDAQFKSYGQWVLSNPNQN